jgi:hypothetical protein
MFVRAGRFPSLFLDALTPSAPSSRSLLPNLPSTPTSNALISHPFQVVPFHRQLGYYQYSVYLPHFIQYDSSPISFVPVSFYLSQMHQDRSFHIIRRRQDAKLSSRIWEGNVESSAPTTPATHRSHSFWRTLEMVRVPLNQTPN